MFLFSFDRKLKRDSMGNNNDVVITDTDRLLLQKDEEVQFHFIRKHNFYITLSGV